MKYFTTSLILSFLIVAQVSAVQADDQVLEVLPQDLEIRLALSAAPPHVRDEATVYVLDPKVGYELAKEGSNGFACLVVRTSPQNPNYRNDIVVPICWDEEGVETHMPRFFDFAAMRAQGMPKTELLAMINANFASGKYRAPRRNGVAPMLSPIFRAYAGADKPRLLNYPHLMFYAPGVTNDEIGGARPMDPTMPWILGDGGPHGLIIQPMGAAEVAKINEEHKDLVDEFCAYKKEWCS